MSFNVGGQSAVVLEEEIAPDYEPDQQEILDYAEFLGMDLYKDREFLGDLLMNFNIFIIFLYCKGRTQGAFTSSMETYSRPRWGIVFL